MNIKQVKVTGTVPPFFGQGIIEGMDPEPGSMSDEDAALLWHWFGMPLTEIKITFNTSEWLADRYPFRISGTSSTSIRGIEHLLHVMVKGGAIIETARAFDIEDGDGWFELHPQEFVPMTTDDIVT